MLITISQYSFPYEAHLAKSRLDAEGISAFIADEHTINMQWLYSKALGGVKLQVPEAFVEAALAALAEDREKDLEEEVGSDVKVCPHCGSEDTQFYQIGRFWAFWTIIALTFPFFPIKDGIKCNQCGKVSKY